MANVNKPRIIIVIASLLITISSSVHAMEEAEAEAGSGTVRLADSASPRLAGSASPRFVDSDSPHLKEISASNRRGGTQGQSVHAIEDFIKPVEENETNCCGGCIVQ